MRFLYREMPETSPIERVGLPVETNDLVPFLQVSDNKRIWEHFAKTHPNCAISKRVRKALNELKEA